MAYRCVVTSTKSGKKELKQWFKGNQRINDSDVPNNVLKNEECKKQRFVQAGPGAKLPPKSKTPQAQGDLLKVYTCEIEKDKKVYRKLGKFIDEYDIPSNERKAIPCRQTNNPKSVKKSPPKKTVKKSAKKSAKRETMKSPQKSKKSVNKQVGKKSQVRRRQINREEVFAKLKEEKPKSNRPEPPKPKSKSKEKEKPPAVITTAMIRKKKAATKRAPSEYVDM